MDENQPRDPHPGASFGVAQTLISSYMRAVELDERISRAAEASQYEAIEQARAFAVGVGKYSKEFATRSLTAEVATTLGLPEATASALIHEAESLVQNFPATLRALGDGAISRQHVRLLLHEAWSLPPEVCNAFEQAALPLAQDLPPPKFRREVRKLRERMHSESLTERLRLERAERKVIVEPGHDGMSWITLYLPSDQVAAISARLDFMGRRTATSEDSRTRAQREADIASELLQHGSIDPDGATNGTHTGGVGSVRPTVFVTVPVLTLLGRSEEPGSLEGFGPIDADTARELAAEAPSFFRILTDPEKGTWMSYGRDAYKVPADLQRFIRLRDGTCRFPGCTHRAVTGENDHTVDWDDGGITSASNLTSLCKKHHRLKHNSDWRVAQLADGIVEWTSPLGRTYQTHPDSGFGGGLGGALGSGLGSGLGGALAGALGGSLPDLLQPKYPRRQRPRARDFADQPPRKQPRRSPRQSPESGSTPRLALPPQLRKQSPQEPTASPRLPRRTSSRPEQARGSSDDEPPF